MRVLARVSCHLVGKRTQPPVSHLEAFVGGDATVMLEQVRKGKRLELEHAHRLSGIEKPDEIKAEVTLQPDDVRVGAMHDLGDARIGEGVVEHVQGRP